MAKKRKNGSEGIAENLGREKLSPVTHWLSTGCTLLDIAIADRFPGGAPGGRVVHIVGSESSGKTLLAQSILGSVQRLGGIAYYDDSEIALDFTRTELFGLETGSCDIGEEVYKSKKGNFEYTQSESIEGFFDGVVYNAVNREHPEIPAAMVCDSLSALPSAKELDEELIKDGYKMVRAKKMSEAFRKYTHRISERNLALIFIDQTRTNVGIMFGDKDTWSGGKALGFYSAVRIKLKVAGKIKIRDDKKQIMGVIVHYRIDKNKVAPPFREGEFEILFDYGIDDVKSNLNFLHNNIDLVDGMEVKKGVGWVYNDKKIGNDFKMVEFVEQEGLEEEIRKRVWGAWQKLHFSPARKAREWK